MGRKMKLMTRTLERYCTSKRRAHKVAPEGFFSVHVGADKQRFVVNMTCLNHPLFQLLLEDAESEFGFGSGDGPLVLPCHVDLFRRVMVEMESDDDLTAASPGCSPVRLNSCRSGSGSYRVLAAPSRMLKTA